MRAFRLWIAALLVLVVWTPLLAAPRARAAVLPVAVELGIRIATLGPLVIQSTGVATVNASGGGLHLQSLALGAGVVNGGPALLAVTDPGAYPITALQLAASNAAGALAESGGGTLGGVIPLAGALRVCLFGSSFACANPLGNLTIPLSVVGAGGTVVPQGFGGVSMTVVGAPWTSGTAAVGVVTLMGGAAGPGSGTSSTAQPGGTLQLVTPIRIQQNIDSLAGFATLTLRFVPEPATALLLGAGVAALAAAGSRRSRP